MKEPVGNCTDCGKTVYCDGGFLNGIVLENHQLRCYDCEELKENNKSNHLVNKP